MIRGEYFDGNALIWWDRFVTLVAAFPDECREPRGVACPTCGWLLDGMADTGTGAFIVAYFNPPRGDAFASTLKPGKAPVLHRERSFRWRCADCRTVNVFRPTAAPKRKHLDASKFDVRIDASAGTRGSVLDAMADLLIDLGAANELEKEGATNEAR